VNLTHNYKATTLLTDSENAPALERVSAISLQEAEAKKSWNDIVFENRNRDYGAYVLRQDYSNNVMIGVITTLIITLAIIFGPAVASLLSSKEKAEVVAPRKLVYTELSAPPPIDKPKPPPPQVQLPKLQKVIKFVPPKVVKEEVIEEVPTIEDIKKNEVAAVDVEAADVVFDEPVEEVVLDEDEIFTVVEQRPEFEGGYEALMMFVKQHMKYPPNARRMHVEGTVHVSFVVNKNGSISDVSVLRGISAECDAEAIRVVKLMPPWKPGRQNGRNVNVRFVLPLKFRLS
jgi:protein TonB